MRPDREYRYMPVEVRQNEDGETVVSGTVIRYGDRADIMGIFTEEFRAGWVSNPADLMYVNRMHSRAQPLATNELGLTLRDTSESMTAEVTLPDTSAGRDASVEFERRLLRGMSLEFRTTKEEYDDEEDHRVIVTGRMFGFALVDRPAYPDSVAGLKRAQEYRAHYGLYVPDPPPTDPEPVPVPAVARRYHFIRG